MEVYAIPFHEQYIVYRPLIRQAFLANSGLVRLIKARLKDENSPIPGEAGNFLRDIGFWSPDPPAPEPRMTGAGFQPAHTVLLMTSSCNLRCIYCYAKGGQSPNLWMTKDLACQAINEVYNNARKLGRREFELSFHGGGEPTVNWKVMQEAVAHARQKDLPCKITLASNGVWSQEQRDFLIREIDGLTISFDGLPEVQNTQRPRADGSGSFDAVMETLLALDEAKSDYGIRITTTQPLVEILPKSVELICHKTKCRSIQVEPCYSDERGVYRDPEPQEAQRFARLFTKALATAVNAGRTLFYSGARPWVVTTCFCRSPEDALVVTPEGDLVTCYEITDRTNPLMDQFFIGRVTPEGPQVDMGKMDAFTRAQIRRREECEGCFCYWHCGGDCASRMAASPDGKRGRCHVNRAITTELIAWHLQEDIKLEDMPGPLSCKQCGGATA